MRAHLTQKTTEDSRATDLENSIDFKLRVIESDSVMLGQSVGLKPEKIENLIVTNLTKFAVETAIDSLGLSKEAVLDIVGQMYDRLKKESDAENAALGITADDEDEDDG